MNTSRTTQEAAPGKPRITIVIAGGSGHTLPDLLEQLIPEYHVIVCSRHRDNRNDSSPVEWRICDPFSMVSAGKAMQGADYAIYLDPPLIPPAGLTQASPEDMEFLLADNFARAADSNGIRGIFIWSGKTPDHLPPGQPSRQADRRLELRRILGSYGVPVTVIRDGRIDISNEPAPFECPVQTALTAEKTAVPDVRSIQRVQLPGDKNADWAARYYLEWLGKLLKWLVIIDDDGGHIHQIRTHASRRPVLELTFLPEQSSAESAVYRISGGVLTKKAGSPDGRLEFRQIPCTRECIIAIHDYWPSLPWFLYKHTQAKAHLWVMEAFRRHLKRMAASQQ